MKAATRTAYGGPEVITVTDIPSLPPRPDEVRVKVMATTVNRTDCGALWGAPWIFRLFVGWPKPRHQVTGTDFAGVVESVGEKVTEWQPGDQVWGFDDNSLPSHAEYMCTKPTKNVQRMPEGVTFEEAVACLEGGHYAINFLNKVKVQAGQRAMVNGGTGAIGSMIVQMLKADGLEVTATCRAEHIERVKKLGADKVMDYTSEDFTQEGTLYDFVFDAVGKSSFGACRKLLKPNGTYISSELGPGNENIYLPLTTRFSAQKVKFPMPSNIPTSLTLLKDRIEKGQLKPLIDSIRSLDEIQDAFTYVNSGLKVGAVVIKP